MSLDAVKNFARATVSTGYNATDTIVVLATGQGANLPTPATDGEFNLVWWNGTDYEDPTDDPNVEIVRCTAKSGDTLTVTRAQEGTPGTTKNASGKVYVMLLALTAKMIQDIAAMISTQASAYAEDTGAADAYVVTLNPAPTAYFEGMLFRFKASATNTTTSTINVNSLGAKTIKRWGGVNLQADDISSGDIVEVIYDGTYFQMMNYTGLKNTSSSASKKITSTDGDMILEIVGTSPGNYYFKHAGLNVMVMGKDGALYYLKLDGGYWETVDIAEPGNSSDGYGRWFKETGLPALWWKPDSAGAKEDLTAGRYTVTELRGRVFKSNLTNGVNDVTPTDDTAYFVYLGQTTKAITPKHVEFSVATAGVGAQTAEVGFFSSPTAPAKANQSLTKLVSTGTVDDLTTTGVKRNTSAFATSIPRGTHLWAGIRISMATTQPELVSLGHDFAQAQVLETASAGALTAAGPWTGAVMTDGADICPDLRAVLD